MRKVAVVTTSYPEFEGDPSGHFVQTEARALADEASIVVVTAGATASRASGNDGILVIRVAGGGAFGWPGVAARVREDPSRIVGALRWARRAQKTLRSLGPLDQVVAHWAVPCGVPVSDALDVPLEAVSHGADVRLLLRLPTMVRHALVVRVLDQATTWRFVSESLRGELLASLRPAERERLLASSIIAPAAISLPDVAARSRELRRATLSDGPGKLVVCVGRLVAGKAFNRALDHVAETTESGAPTRLVVVGDGPERSRLEAQARALGIDARFVGRTTHTEALGWIGASDALLHPSRKEGLSTVVREADALGIPIVRIA